MTKRKDIQILRGISVSLVLVFHIRSSIIPNGYLGVDVFFFITGFCLYSQMKMIVESEYKSGIDIFKRFIQRRFFRLMPAFIICTSITTLLLTFLASLRETEAIYVQAILSLVFLGNISANELVGNYFQPNPNPFLHYWSLSSEWQLYILSPILFVLAKNFLKLSFAKIILLFTFMSLLCNIWLENEELFNYYSPLSRIWEFCFGMYVCKLTREKYSLHKFPKLFGIMTCVCLILILMPYKFDLLVGQVISAVFFFSFIMSRLQPREGVANGLVWLGDRSYSIYLYHMPLIYLSIHSPLSADQFWLRLFGVIVALLAIFFLANWSFNSVEKSTTDKGILLNKYLRGYFFSKKAYIHIVLTLMALFFSH